MAEVTNGQEISTILNVQEIIDGVPTGNRKSYSILPAFTGYGAITSAQYARLSEANRQARVNAFKVYVQNTYYGGENINYTNPDIQQNTSACPINGSEIPWTGITIPQERLYLSYNVGATGQTSVIFTPSNATNKSINSIEVIKYPSLDITGNFDIVILASNVLNITVNSLTNIEEGENVDLRINGVKVGEIGF